MRLRTSLCIASSLLYAIAGCGGDSNPQINTDASSDSGSDSQTVTSDANADSGSETPADTGPTCVDPAKDCAAPASVCAPAVCTESGTCGTTNAAAGTACTDSGGKVCDGSGKCVACNAPTDCPASTTTCATPTCASNKCGSSFAAKGTSCSDSGGIVCDGAGTCVASHCTDGIKDADETDTDCGGSCPGCATGLNCAKSSDCASGNACSTGKCAAITCKANAPTNGTVNGGTTAVSIAFGATATYACNTGYTLTGTAPSCAGTAIPGTLSGAEPTCVPVDCGAPPSVTNAGTPVVSGGAGGTTTTTFGALASYTCNTGWARTGPNATCGASGSWSAAPTCIIAEFVNKHGSLGVAQVPVGMVVDSSENMYVPLYFNGAPSDFGNSVKVTTGGGWDTAVVKYDKFGTAQWAAQISSVGADVPYGIATDSKGNIYVVGTATGPTVKFDATTTVTMSGAYIAEYSSAGTYLWSRSLGGSNSYAESIAIDSSDNIYVAGFGQGTVDYGGGPKTAKGSNDIFIASYDGTSSHAYRWANVYGSNSCCFGPPGNNILALATDSTGNLYIGGTLGGPGGNLGGSTIAVAPGAPANAIFASYDTNGVHRWSKSFLPSSTTGYLDSQINGLATDKSGHVFASVQFRDKIDLGGGAVTTGASGGESTILGEFNTSDGSYVRQRAFTMAPPFTINTISVDTTGNVYIGGNANNGGQDFGSGVMASGAYIAEYGPDLSYKFARVTAGGAYSYTRGLAVTTTGDFLATGSFDRGVIDWGAGAVPIGGSGTLQWMARVRPLPFSSGLAAHYSARDTTTAPHDVANNLLWWLDTSGNSATLTPGTKVPKFAATGVNARPAIDFSGAASLANAAVSLSSTDVTVFVVMKSGTPAPAGNWGVIANHGDRDLDWSMEQNTTGANNTHFKSNTDNTGAQLVCSVGSVYILTGRAQGTTRTFYRSDSTGTTTSTATGNTITTGSKAFSLGASSSGDASNAMVAEIVYFQRALSDAEVTQMINYLGTGWNL